MRWNYNLLHSVRILVADILCPTDIYNQNFTENPENQKYPEKPKKSRISRFLDLGRCCGQQWVRYMFCSRDLWWTMPLHICHWCYWDTLWIPNDHMDLCQTPCVQVPVFPAIGVTWSVPSSSCLRSTWVVLWLLFFRSAASTFPNKRSTLQGPFQGVPSR